MIKCRYLYCPKMVKGIHGQRRHESLSHVNDTNKCMGCNKEFETIQKRNRHHGTCHDYHQFVLNKNKLISVVEPNVDVSSSAALAEPASTAPLVTPTSAVTSHVVATAPAAPQVVQYITNNNTYYNNNSRNTQNTQNNVSITNNLQPVVIDEMVKYMVSIIQQSDFDYFKHVNPESLGKSLAAKFHPSFYCSDKDRRTVHWIDATTGQLVVDNKCAKLDQRIYSQKDVLMPEINKKIDAYQPPVQPHSTYTPSQVNVEALQYALSLAQFKHHLNADVVSQSKTLGSVMARQLAKHTYKQLSQPVDVTRDMEKFSKLSKMIITTIQDTLADRNKTIMYQTAEYLGLFLHTIIQEYTQSNQMEPVAYEHHTQYDECVLYLSDDSKQMHTMKVRDFMKWIRVWLTTLLPMFNLAKALMSPPSTPAFVNSPQVNYDNMINFIQYQHTPESQEASPLLASASVEQYEQCMFMMMSSSETND